MVKPRRSKKKSRSETASASSPKLPSDLSKPHSLHKFETDEISQLQQNLLRWYDKHKRDLPWRTYATTEPDPNKRSYAVLVSEVMLQQTQVTTVQAYYKKWMARWPTLADLAAATQEQVYEMWAGLGYYSRGRRLHEIACKVHTELSGEMPSSVDDLLRLPGVGRYTAGAVSSIAFSQRSALVDGNVIRVMARLRAIGACSTTQTVSKAIWELAEQALDPERPGDFNQALMELGATVCTAKNPQCDACPVRSLCLAYKRTVKTASRVELADIEELPGCTLCLSSAKWEASLGVMNYPRKEKKTSVSQQETAVCVIHRQGVNGLQFFMEKRPKDGLLANLWQFPSLPLALGLPDEDVVSAAQKGLSENYNVSTSKQPAVLGRISHQFSHISQVYVVLSVQLQGEQEPSCQQREQQWVDHTDVNQLAISTGMKKIYKLFNSQEDNKTPVGSKKRKASDTPEAASKHNKLVTDFFKARPSTRNNGGE